LKRLRILAITIAAMVAFGGTALVSANGAGGVTGPAFYVDGELYRTVGTPTDLSRTKAPDHSFDTIYAFAQQMNVAEAKPGDRDYNGGRWRVKVVTFDDYDAAVAAYAGENGIFDSDSEVIAAIGGVGGGSLSEGPSFVCPVIPVPGS
jgi:hypothetical protein